MTLFCNKNGCVTGIANILLLIDIHPACLYEMVLTFVSTSEWSVYPGNKTIS